jgi:hypothetical protein|tara:strand:+ start:1444 stop:1917 length:474 start_codon:yes stop_codon:yes gene_type:complete
MGKFHNLLDAKFNPPRNWTLDTPLKFDSDTLSDEGRDLLKYCGVRVTNKNVVSVPKGYITDLASVPRFCWAFIAPFDVARAAVVHDILYEKINTAYKGEKILTKHDREKYRKVADDVFKEGMESAVPPVPKWKIWAAYNAVRVFGRWAINSSAPRRA